MFMLIVFLSILSNLSILSMPSTLSVLNTQPLSARKITTRIFYGCVKDVTIMLQVLMRLQR